MISCDLAYIRQMFNASLTVLGQLNVHDKGAHKALSMLDEIIKQLDWQLIETAPKDTTRVILGDSTQPDMHADIGFYHERGENSGWYSITSEASGYNPWRVWPPTHWMPLPKPPTTTE